MSIKDKLRQHLEQLQILTANEIDVILAATIMEEHKKGETLLRAGQVQEHCYMIIEGCIREYMLTDGEEKTTAFYTEGDKITSYSSEGNEVPSKHFLECMEDCVITISTQNFENELRKLVPRLDAIIQQVAKEQLGNNKEQLTRFVTSSPEERYKDLLDTKPSLFNRVPQHQIASFLGVKPESLSRIRKRIHTKQKTEKDTSGD